MSRLDDLVKKLSIAAAAEGKSVTVITHPASLDVCEKGAGSGLAITAMLAAMAAQPTLGLGALNLDHIKTDKEGEPMM